LDPLFGPEEQKSSLEAVDRFVAWARENTGLIKEDASWKVLTGTVYSMCRHHDEAIVAFEEGVADPKCENPRSAYNELACIYRKRSEFPRAIETIRKHREFVTQSADYKSNRIYWANYLLEGECHKELEDQDASIACYLECINALQHATKGDQLFEGMALKAIVPLFRYWMESEEYDNILSVLEKMASAPGGIEYWLPKTAWSDGDWDLHFHNKIISAAFHTNRSEEIIKVYRSVLKGSTSRLHQQQLVVLQNIYATMMIFGSSKEEDRESGVAMLEELLHPVDDDVEMVYWAYMAMKRYCRAVLDSLEREPTNRASSEQALQRLEAVVKLDNDLSISERRGGAGPEFPLARLHKLMGNVEAGAKVLKIGDIINEISKNLSDQEQLPGALAILGSCVVVLDEDNDAIGAFRYGLREKSMTCDGCEVALSPKEADIYICRECIDTGFCSACHQKLRAGALDRLICGKSHSTLFMPHLDPDTNTEAETDGVVIDGTLVPVEQWVQSLREKWHVPEPIEGARFQAAVTITRFIVRWRQQRVANGKVASSG
jgi:tetratricopeptide (TPR) repeat protein